MFDGRRARARAAVVASVAWLGAVGWVHAQGGASPSPMLAEQAFKDVRILRGIPVDEFMSTMGFLSAALALNCQDCHVAESGGDWARYADDTRLKQTTRRMMVMVNTINTTNFGGRPLVTCNTCHRGSNRPNTMPSLLSLYAEPAPDEPGEVFQQADGQPAAAAVLGRYIEALGGAARVSRLTSLTGAGRHRAFGDAQTSRAEFFAKAPSSRAVVIHAASGDTTTVVDPRAGWLAAPATDRPLPAIEITRQELEGLRLEAETLFPARIEGALTGWRVGFPKNIRGRDVQPVQGRTASGAVVTLCFDLDSGLLARMVRVTASPIGPIVTEVDFDDYREVEGVKVPHRWGVTWLSGRSTFEWANVRANVAIDEARFAKPAPSVPPRP